MCRLKIHPAASELSMQLCTKQHAKFGEVLNQLRTRFTSNVHCRRARYVNCTLLGGAQHVLSLRSPSAGIGRRLKAFNHSFWAGLLAKLCRKWITWKVHKIAPSDTDKLSEFSDNVAATTTQSCSIHLMANDFTILYPKNQLQIADLLKPLGRVQMDGLPLSTGICSNCSPHLREKKRSPCRHSLGQDSRGSVHTGNNLVKCRSERGKKRAKFFKGFNISLDSGSMKCASWPELQEIQPYK